MNGTQPGFFLSAIFAAMLVIPPLLQVGVEARRGERPHILDVFNLRPSPENLRAYERDIESASVTVAALRPWMQAAQFFALRDGGQKALIGRDGWLFYQPSVNFVTQRPGPGESTPRQALAAVLNFRDALAARGIRLILMPAPNKESVYPEKLSCFAAPPERILSEETRAFLAGCAAAGVEYVDLFALYRQQRRGSTPPLYLMQDSHWSPEGMSLAAAAVAGRIRAERTLNFRTRPERVGRKGDIVRMLRSPEIECRLSPELVACAQVLESISDRPYQGDPSAEVLVLGDSFLRIYQLDEPGSAGFSAHLARQLGCPVASIINDGGASTLVRQELFRKPELLAKARVVVWEFAERDLRLGMDGWQIVPLPASQAASGAGTRIHSIHWKRFAGFSHDH